MEKRKINANVMYSREDQSSLDKLSDYLSYSERCYDSDDFVVSVRLPDTLTFPMRCV